MDHLLIQQFETGGTNLRRAVEGLTREELLARPGSGLWSIQEVVIHLADSDTISIDRMKRIVTEDNPALLYADENAYVERLHCDRQDMEDALLFFEVGRRQWARVLRRLPEHAFARTGQHNRRGPLTLGGMVAEYIEHLEHHLEFILAKRAKLNKALS